MGQTRIYPLEIERSKRRITPEDTEKMLSDYYEEHGWDVGKGIPTKEKLFELGLEEAVADIGAM